MGVRGTEMLYPDHRGSSHHHYTQPWLSLFRHLDTQWKHIVTDEMLAEQRSHLISY